MADKKINNITLPDGTTVAIPAWASEATMSQIAGFMSASNKVDQKFITLINSLGGDLGAIQRAVSGLTTTIRRDANQDDRTAETQKDFANSVVGTAKKINKLRSVFGNAEKPLTSLKEGAASLVEGLRLGDRVAGAFSSRLTLSANGTAALAGATDVLADAVLAYVGWNAAKIEQFAQAQQTAIDAGVLFQRGAAAYDDLRHHAIDSGVTYTHLLKNASEFGSGMLALGSDMASGTQNFGRFFGELNSAADALGDLGMSSADMMSAYAEYLDYARRTGRVNRDLNQSAEDINNEFINLQIEAGAIASLTSISRSEAMRRRTASVDTFGQGALMMMRQANLPGHAEVSEAIIHGLGLIAPESGAIQTFLNAFQQELFEKADDPRNFDVSARLQQMMPGLESSLNYIMPGFVDNIEEMVRAGALPQDQVTSYIFNALNSANMDRIASQGAAADSVAGMTNRLQAEILNIQRNFGSLGDAERLREEEAVQRRNLRDAGRVTTEMNDMTRRFLQVQEVATLEMETISGLFNGLTSILEEGRGVLDTLLGTQRVNEFGGIDEPGQLIRTTDEFGNVIVSNGVLDQTGALVSAPGGVVLPPSNFDPSSLGGGARVEGDIAAVLNDEGVLSGGVVQAQDSAGTRTQDLDERLVAILHQAGLDSGLSVVVGSGGQMSMEEYNAAPGEKTRRGSTYFLNGRAVRVGSTRHDHGAAADLSFRDSSGRMLSMANASDLARIQEYIRSARELGATGIGAGRQLSDGTFDYMGEHTVHIGFGAESLWGDDGSAANTPQWLRDIGRTTTLGSRASEITERRTTTDDPHDEHSHDDNAAARAAFFSQQQLGTYFDGLNQAGQDSIFERLMAADDHTREEFLARIRREPADLNEDTLRQLGVNPNDPNFDSTMSGFADFLQQQVNHFDELFHEENPDRRIFGGLVNANMPYLVGDALGLNTAELFVPQTAGQVVNNTDLRRILNTDLTEVQNTARMLQSTDLSGLINSKEGIISAMNMLLDTVRRINRNNRNAIITDIANSR